MLCAIFWIRFQFSSFVAKIASKIHFNDFTRPLIGALLGQEVLCGRYIDNMLTIKGTAGGGKINTPPAHEFLQERIEEEE